MCHTIIRVTYLGNDKQDIDVRDPDEIDNRIADLQAKDTVQRIEVYNKARDYKRTIEWKDLLP
jgi:hypothetical protein